MYLDIFQLFDTTATFKDSLKVAVVSIMSETSDSLQKVKIHKEGFNILCIFKLSRHIEPSLTFTLYCLEYTKEQFYGREVGVKIKMSLQLLPEWCLGFN